MANDCAISRKRLDNFLEVSANGAWRKCKRSVDIDNEEIW